MKEDILECDARDWQSCMEDGQVWLALQLAVHHAQMIGKEACRPKVAHNPRKRHNKHGLRRHTALENKYNCGDKKEKHFIPSSHVSNNEKSRKDDEKKKE